MGALTIKSYNYETRPWELSKICVPNLLTSYPQHVLLYFKDNHLIKILPWNRNDFISNELRFSLSFFSSISSFNEKQKIYLKKNLLNLFIVLILILQYINNLGIMSLQFFKDCQKYMFNLCSNFLIIHDHLNKNVFNLKLKNFKFLQSSNLKFFNFSHIAFMKNLNDCLNDFFSHICIEKKSIMQFTDFYFYLYRKQQQSLVNNDALDGDEKLVRIYSEFSILNFAVEPNCYNNFIIKFFYKFVLRLVYRKFIIDFSYFSIKLKNLLFKYFPYHMSYHYQDNISYSSHHILCLFSSFNFMNSVGFIMIDDFQNKNKNHSCF